MAKLVTLQFPYVFTTRDTYKAAVKIWRDAYRELSETGRMAKETVRNLNRAFDVTRNGGNAGPADMYISDEFAKSIRNRQQVRERATKMIKIRHAMKVESQRQYLIDRQAEAEANQAAMEYMASTV